MGAYKVAIVVCGGMSSVVLRVLNPMVTYVATCLVLQKQPDLNRSVSGLTVLALVAWYNIAPIWDNHVSLVAQRRTLAQAARRIEKNIRKSRAAAKEDADNEPRKGAMHGMFPASRLGADGP